MSPVSLSAAALSVIALAVGVAGGASGSGDDPENYPDPISYGYDLAAVWTDDLLNPIGEGMKNAALAAIPVGIEVMAVTAGIPVAKKVIKQLGN